MDSIMQTIYQIGRSKKNTVKIISNDSAFSLVLTENGGQYNTTWKSIEQVIENLASMWGIGVLESIPFTNKRAKVLAKLKLVSGDNIIQNS
jgi:hypothetical protein